MSKWEKLKKSYVTRFPPTKEEEKTIPLCFKDIFAAAKLGTHTLFAKFEEEPVWVTKSHTTWKYVSTNKDVDVSEIVSWFPYYQQLKDINPFTGTACFDRKGVYYNILSETWQYLNNHTVYFNGSEASESNKEDSEEESEEEESKNKDNKNPSEPRSDTAKVDKLLQSAETSVTSALQKISSRPGTPAQQISALPGISRNPSPEPSQIPTPPVSKGKQPVSRLTTLWQAVGNNEGLDVEVIDVEQEVGKGKAKDAKSEQLKSYKAVGVQCGGQTREQSEDCSLKFTGLIY